MRSPDERAFRGKPVPEAIDATALPAKAGGSSSGVIPGREQAKSLGRPK
jgi:hypothetical protein